MHRFYKYTINKVDPNRVKNICKSKPQNMHKAPFCCNSQFPTNQLM